MHFRPEGLVHSIGFLFEELGDLSVVVTAAA